MSKIIQITSKTQFDEVIANNAKVLVDFKAEWCGPCKMLNPIIEQLAEQEKNVAVVQVDVDKNQDLALEYKIMSIPAIMVYENQKVKSQHTGFMPLNKLQEMVK
ncbi:thioredoxin [Williamsoniiplasma luminosum]|uniref:Thioredoxin n=1 Tax=Williamsoniiplasma luminosum TaxID=214888 RepID=A0A2K8NSC7_9MOLU|nr:thioredoxin [Williamsoniiplasma luminosum]ATZ16752.1 thioredoxin [Williamsoniiplasma luminosum]